MEKITLIIVVGYVICSMVVFFSILYLMWQKNWRKNRGFKYDTSLNPGVGIVIGPLLWPVLVMVLIYENFSGHFLWLYYHSLYYVPHYLFTNKEDRELLKIKRWKKH